MSKIEKPTVEAEVVDTTKATTEATETPKNKTAELAESEKLHQRIGELEAMVRSVSDSNAVQQFDDAKIGKGNTMYAIPLYQGEVVKSWSHASPVDVRRARGEGDDSVNMVMHKSGETIKISYREWVMAMYVTEQIHSTATSITNEGTFVSFSFKAESDKVPTEYTLAKQFLNAR